ncbi:hypothetical protein [Amycolatopsis lexingtonensis]|uniref:hypothetical protein n=1 Tax=Amycolatopsis lexingtonensis TaxID=218822 RepID=UPI003F717B97
MSHNERLREALSRLEELNTEIAALARLAKRFPDEPEVGSVLKIFKRYEAQPNSWRGTRFGSIYTYVAVRATPKDWFMTGRDHGGRPMTWDALVDFIGESKVWLVDGWSRIGEGSGD